jgi:hypothetical protein
MKTPERSAALARALKSEPDGLPKDFAAQVAALAEAGGAEWQVSLSDVGLIGAFATMISICVMGWVRLAAESSGGAEWLGAIVGALASHPWLVIGIAGVATVQMLTFRRRTAT